jgi:SNF2 family DNA or RNA helicase
MSRQQLAQYMSSPLTSGNAPSYVRTPRRQNGTNGRTGTRHQAVQPSARSGLPFPADGRLDPNYFNDAIAPATDTEAVHNLIERIGDHANIPPSQRTQTPSSMDSQLMEHQKIALTWLLKQERSSHKGGILADEMGLGKTVEAIALILAHGSPDPGCRTTLIVAPVALMRQWENELKKHVKDHLSLSVFVYHGSGKKNTTYDKLRTYDVVLTTYGTLGAQLRHKESMTEAKADADTVLLGTKSMWYRVILDEAQTIKTRTTQASRACGELQSQYRLAMTGTPMMVRIFLRLLTETGISKVMHIIEAAI